MNRMSRRLHLISLLAGALVLGCAEGTAPLNAPPAAGPHFLQWDTSAGPVTFAATGETPHGELELVQPPPRAAGQALVLDRFEASFWAVRGESRTVQINYLDEAGAEDDPYVRLTVTDPVQRPDGSPIALGDSVLITVSVEPTDLVIHLAPSARMLLSIIRESAK